MPRPRLININIGILGHVDCGKTTLCRGLSTKSSTASFDKNPQSQERGITLDLGFSSFTMPPSPHFQTSSTSPQINLIQVTLVDCPGHASLIKTIISGAQIIDMMILVIDITKGIQTQTAECLIIGEITCSQMIVVLNKIDLLPESVRDLKIEKMTKLVRKVLSKTKFGDTSIVSLSAKEIVNDIDKRNKSGLNELMKVLSQEIKMPERSSNGPLLLAIDHCFLVKGQGTVLTGTVIQGSVKVNQTIEIPAAQVSRKVKSIQRFGEPIETAFQGDRIGLCVTQLDSKLIERGICCEPSSLKLCFAIICKIEKILHYKSEINSKSKFHVTILHDTALAKIEMFKGPKSSNFEIDQEYEYINTFSNDLDKSTTSIFALLELEKPLIVKPDTLIIGSKLDLDINANICRLAFHGSVLVTLTQNYRTTFLPTLKIFKMKTKMGQVERIPNAYEVIGRSLFKKETNMDLFSGLKVKLTTGDEGVIDGSFGQSGKVKIRIPKGLQDLSLVERWSKKAKAKSNLELQDSDEKIQIILQFKRFIYDKSKKVIQT